MPIIIAYILNIADYLFTLYWVRKYGIETELNPIGRWMFSTNTAWLFKIVLVGMLLGGLHLYIRSHPSSDRIAYIPLGWYGAVCLYHIILAIITKH